jgi:hypothetical protein
MRPGCGTSRDRNEQMTAEAAAASLSTAVC